MISPSLPNSFNALLERLTPGLHVVLSTHINPDGDGLGSQVALLEFLAARGLHPHVLNHDAVPQPYAFLDPGGLHLRKFDAARDAALVERADLILIVDTNTAERLGSMAQPVRGSRAEKIIIDHHLDPDPAAHLVVSDETACATGEIVFRLLEHAGALPLSLRSSTALYAAIMTDTGSFRFPKTDASVHSIAAQLLAAGADPSAIYANIYESGNASRLQLLGNMLSTLSVSHGGRIGTMFVTREMFRKTGTSEKDTDTFVSYPLTVSGVVVSVLVSELDDATKINVRTKGSIPANLIAKSFGGNGHLNAAGARVSPVGAPSLLPRIVEVASSYLGKKDSSP